MRGRDVFLLQSTAPPVERHLMELLLLADACRRAGAGRLTGIIPCSSWLRQWRSLIGIIVSLSASLGLARMLKVPFVSISNNCRGRVPVFRGGRDDLRLLPGPEGRAP